MHAALRFTDPDENVLEGLLCPYNVTDSYNTRFTPNTNFHLQMFPDGSRPLCWHHGLDSETGADPIGRVSRLETTPHGLLMRAIVDGGSRWYTKVRDAVRRGLVGLSSGSLPHLVAIDEKSGDILRWPVVEASLTPSPSCSAAVVTRHTLRAETARAHFRAAGLTFPTPPLESARPWHSYPYRGSPLQMQARAAMRDFQRLELRAQVREELEAGRRLLLLTEAREELRAAERLLEELDAGERRR